MTTSFRDQAANAILTWLAKGLQLWMDEARRKPLFVFLSFAALCLMCGHIAFTQLGVNSDTRAMISPKLDYRQADAAFEAAFPDLTNTALVVIRAPTAEEAELFAEKLTTELQNRPDVVRSVFAPAVDPFFHQNALLYLEPEDLDDNLSRLSQAAPFLEDIIADPTLSGLMTSLADIVRLADDGDFESELLDDILGRVGATMEARAAGEAAPLSWRAVFSGEDGDDKPAQVVLSVDPVLNFNSLQPARQASRAIVAIANDIAAASGGERISVGVTGDQVLRTEELQTVADGIWLSLSLSFVFMLILLTLALRSAILVFAAMLSLIINLILTAGFAAVAVGSLNLVSVAFAILMIGLGIDFAIHLCLHFEEERRKCADVELAVKESARDIGPALALAAITTAIAFFAFIPTDFVGIAQLGIISGAGVLIACMVAVTVLPAFFSIMTKAKTAPGADATMDRLNTAFRPAVKPVAAVTIILCIASLPLLPQVRFNADPMALRNLESPSVKTFNLLFDDKNTVPYRLQVLTDDLAEADAIAERIQPLGEVDTAVTLSSFVPEDQEDKLDAIDFAASGLFFAFEETPDIDGAADPAAFSAASEELKSALQRTDGAGAARLSVALDTLSNAAAAREAVLSETADDLLGFLPFQVQRLADALSPGFITLDDLPRDLAKRYVTPDGRARVEISSSLNVNDAAMRESFVEAVRAEEPRVTGAALNVLESGKVVSRSMVQATLTAGLLGALMLWLFLRNTVLVGFILLPLVLAAVLTSAASVLLGMPYNFANVIVLPLLIGLGVDSGVHLALRARGAAKGFGVYSTTTPRAVFFSALTTIASFGTLALSAHRGTASMGALLTFGVLATLICTLVVLPAVLELSNRSGRRVSMYAKKMGFGREKE